MTIPNRTFVFRQPAAINLSPFPLDWTSKHVGGCYLPVQRRVLAGSGDFTNSSGQDSGAHLHYHYDMTADTWTCVTGWCGAPGTTTPMRLEESPYCYDAKRGVVWTNMGQTNPDGGACTLSLPSGFPTGSTLRTGTMTYDPASHVWTQILPEGSTLPADSDWVYDPYTDSLIGNAGTSIAFFPLTPYPPSAGATHYYGLPTEPFDSGTQTGYGDGSLASLMTPIDIVGRMMYFFIETPFYNAGNYTGLQLRFWSFNLDTHVYTKLPQPAYAPTYSVGECRPLWDSRNKAVIFPYTNSPDGIIYQMWVYDTTAITPAWVNYGIAKQGSTKVVRGNRGFYDPEANLFFFSGSAFGVTFIDSSWIWRYQ